MTVASLWKALDRAGCGKAVGPNELLGHDKRKEKTTPFNFNDIERARSLYPSLAVDLSIWICESLTSTAIAANHAEPALHLVYTRTMRLLKLGIKLIFVIEGKRRIRRTDTSDSDDFRKRRSGTKFWKACQRCEEMFRMLGVPVVRAKAEGEALCALLNQLGIVDGVISNDGDCLLFGAQVLYTKFSIENLEQKRVMRYDLSDLQVHVDDDDSDEYDVIGTFNKNQQKPDVTKLSRNDLIVFAILTGSDLAGNGLRKVGCRKAIRFIRKCQIDNPLKSEVAAIEELKSWAKSVSVGNSHPPQEEKERSRCSCCCHPGTKASHKKYGCELCGTGPGEPCFAVSPGGRFRKSLRTKAMKMGPAFDPVSILESYQRPNDMQIPLCLVGKTAQSLEMEAPCLQEFLQSSLIVRGHSYAESRQYLRQSLSSYFARTILLDRAKTKGEKDVIKKVPPNKNQPHATQIKKSITRNGKACFEVQWVVDAATTDADGNPIDEFEFITIEEQRLIKKCYPKLIEKYEKEEKETKKQGNAEREKRRAFLDSMREKSNEYGKPDAKTHEQRIHRQRTRRHSFFVREKGGTSVLPGELITGVGPASRVPGFTSNASTLRAKNDLCNRDRSPITPIDNCGEVIDVDPDASKQIQYYLPVGGRKFEEREKAGIKGKSLCALVPKDCGDDVYQLLRFVKKQEFMHGIDCSIADNSTISSHSCDELHLQKPKPESDYLAPLTPGHLHFLQQNQRRSSVIREASTERNDMKESSKGTISQMFQKDEASKSFPPIGLQKYQDLIHEQQRRLEQPRCSDSMLAPPIAIGYPTVMIPQDDSNSPDLKRRREARLVHCNDDVEGIHRRLFFDNLDIKTKDSVSDPLSTDMTAHAWQAESHMFPLYSQTPDVTLSNSTQLLRWHHRIGHDGYLPESPTKVVGWHKRSSRALDLKNLKPIEHEVEELEHPLCYADAVLDSNDQIYEFDTAERHGALDSFHCIISHVNLRAAGRRMSKGRAIELKDYSCEEYERIVKIAEEKLAGKQREARLELECSRYCGS